MTPLERFHCDLARAFILADPAFVLPSPGSGPLLPVLCMHDDAEMQIPGVAIAASQSKGKHPKLVNLTLFVRLRIHSQAATDGEETEAFGTAATDALAWLEILRARLTDAEAFRAQLLTLTEDERAGSQIMTRIVDADISHSINRDDRTHTWEIIIEHKIMIL